MLACGAKQTKLTRKEGELQERGSDKVRIGGYQAFSSSLFLFKACIQLITEAYLYIIYLCEEILVPWVLLTIFSNLSI